MVQMLAVAVLMCTRKIFDDALWWKVERSEMQATFLQICQFVQEKNTFKNNHHPSLQYPVNSKVDTHPT